MTLQFPIAAIICMTALTFGCASGSKAQGSKPGERKMEFIAHRGESYDAPENTLASLELGFERGADGVEMDLHLTADHKLITIHDPDTFRVTGGKNNGGQKLIVAQTSASELERLDVGRWKSANFAGQRMPMVEDVLGTLPPDTKQRLFIEVKVGPDAAAPLVEAIKKAGHSPDRTAIISFKLDTCAEVKKQMPELKVYYLADFKENKKTGAPPPTIDELIKTAKDANLDGLDLNYKGPLDTASIKKIHDAGLKCYIWTLDDPDIAKQMINAGVDGITTNRAQWLRQQLGVK
jgi:glycerophosphoryl diester phosphodiesterase